MVYVLYAHQQKILKEMRIEFKTGKRSVMLVSPAGSGKSVMISNVTKELTDLKKNVLFMVHRKELIDQIEQSFMENEIDMNFVTLLSVIKTRNRLIDIPKPDLIITDEAHHSKAKTYIEIYKHFEDVPRIGFTATPIRLSGEGFEDVYEVLVEGESVSWLIENGFLAPFRYFSLPLLDRDKLKKQSGEFSNASISKALAGTTIFGDVVDTYLDKAEGEQAILYAHNVEYSKMYARAFKTAGINAIHVDSNTPKNERDLIMEGFKKKEYQVLCNVDLISEGFNVPDCSTVILLRPTQSLTVYVQQSMRGMRYQKSKISTIIDHVGNYLKHGLPDTDRIWSLDGNELEELEDVLEECSACHGIFERWISKGTDTHTIKQCPICETEFSTEKEVITNDKERETTTELKEITQEELWYMEVKRISKFNHLKFRDNVVAIIKIFVARNIIAEYENKKTPYKFPIHFAIRQFLEHTTQSSINEFKLYEQFESIEDEFGKKYKVNAIVLFNYYCNLLPDYGYRQSIFEKGRSIKIER